MPAPQEPYSAPVASSSAIRVSPKPREWSTPLSLCVLCVYVSVSISCPLCYLSVLGLLVSFRFFTFHFIDLIVVQRNPANAQVQTSSYAIITTSSIISIQPLNLEELKEDKAVQFAAVVTNRFTALEAAQNEVTPEDLWKGIKTLLLEVARETIGSVKSQKKEMDI